MVLSNSSKILKTKNLLLLFLTMCLNTACFNPSAMTKDPPCSFKLKAKLTISNDSIHIQVTNTGSRRLILPDISNCTGSYPSVLNQQGEYLPPRVKIRCGGNSNPVQLAPGETKTILYYMTLSKLYDIVDKNDDTLFAYARLKLGCSFYTDTIILNSKQK